MNSEQTEPAPQTFEEAIEQIADRVAGKLLDSPTGPNSQYMTADQVARQLNLSNARSIPSELRRFYPGGRKAKPLFKRSDVEDFIEQPRETGTPPNPGE